MLVEKHQCDGVFDEHGCPGKTQCVDSADQCQSQAFDSDGCRIHASLTCSEEEQECEALYDSEGCLEEPFCLSDDANCVCPKQVYDSDGCPLPTKDVECDPKTQIKCEARKFL